MSFRMNPLAAAIMSTALFVPALSSAQNAAREIVVQGHNPGVEARTERVSFADLDLDHPAGAHTLLLRLRGAANRVCGSPRDAHVIKDDYKACVHDSLDHAVGDVNSPLVTTLYHRED